MSRSLTPVEQHVYDLLAEGPRTYDEIANALDVGNSTARDHVSSLRSKGLSIGEESAENGNAYYLRAEAGEHPTNQNTKRLMTTSDKRQISQHLNQTLETLEERLQMLLDESEPPVADGGHRTEPDNEDIVLHVTDDHFGSLIEDEYGNIIYDTDIALGRRQTTFEKAFEVAEERRNLGAEIDTFNLLLGGDIVDGDGVYEGHRHEMDIDLEEQLDVASALYIEQIRRASKEFDSVKVVCQSGNHGQIQSSSASGLNADRYLYMMLDKMVRQSDMENVTFIRNSATGFTNFEVRGHRMHLRHGDDSLEHIGTSSAKRRWFNWRDKHHFDQAYRGHYHAFEIDTLTRTKETAVTDSDGEPVYDEDGELQVELSTENLKVIMTGSIKPPGSFEESIAKWSQPSATIHGVNSEKPLTWLRAIEFE